MPAKRIFTQAERDLAQSMLDACESWRAIGRALRCNEDTIRRDLDPAYGAARSAGIIQRWRVRRECGASVS